MVVDGGKSRFSPQRNALNIRPLPIPLVYHPNTMGSDCSNTSAKYHFNYFWAWAHVYTCQKKRTAA